LTNLTDAVELQGGLDRERAVMKAYEILEEEQAAHDDAVILKAAANGRQTPPVENVDAEDKFGTTRGGKRRSRLSNGTAISGVSVDDAMARYFLAQASTVEDEETKKRRLKESMSLRRRYKPNAWNWRNRAGKKRNWTDRPNVPSSCSKYSCKCNDCKPKLNRPTS
jgi:hypothetical protein